MAARGRVSRNGLRAVLALSVLLGGCASPETDVKVEPNATPAAPSASASPSPDTDLAGTIAFQSNRDGPDYDIYTMDLATGEVVAVTQDDADDYYPEWSPEGDRIVFAKADGPDLDLFVVEVATGATEQLTDDDRDDLFPDWSPDGRSILYTHVGPDGSDLFRMDLGDNRARRVTETKESEGAAAWSPDGRRVAYDIGGDLYVLELRSGARRRVLRSESTEEMPAWLPDSSAVAVMLTNVKGNVDVASLPVASGRPKLLTRSGMGWPDWSPSGDHLVGASSKEGNGEIYVVDVAAGSEVNLTQNPADDTAPAWKP